MLQFTSSSLSAFTEAQSILDELGDDEFQKDFKAIKTPRLAFIGLQSHGKSSTVETLIGMDILPKGRDTATKGPLEIKIFERGKQQGPFGDEDWARVEYTVSDKKGAPVRQQDQVTALELADKLQEISSQILSTKGGLTDKPITLDLFIRGTVPLAFVDLPGLIFDDAQQRDASTFVEKLWKKYCSSPETIIVLVHSAHDDYKANKAIQIARGMDPTGERTLIVLTHLDKVEPKTLDKMLQEKTLVAKRGIIGVINRSQDDLDNGVSLQKARSNEESKLKKALINPALAKRHGSRVLAETLVKILRAEIAKATPKIIEEINLRLSVYRDERSELGEIRGVEDYLRSAVDVTLDYSEAFRYAITGKTERTGGNSVKVAQRYTASTAIRELFKHSLPARIRQLALDLTDEQIKTIIANAIGVVGDEAFNDEACKKIVTMMLENFVGVGRECVRAVHQAMLKEVNDCIDLNQELEQNMTRLPVFSQEIMKITREILDEEQQKALRATKELAETQQAHISLDQLRKEDEHSSNADNRSELSTVTRKPPAANIKPRSQPTVRKYDIDDVDEGDHSDGDEENETTSDDGHHGQAIDEDYVDDFEESSLMQSGIDRITPETVSEYRDLAVRYTNKVRNTMVSAMVKSVTHNMIDAVCDSLRQRLLKRWIELIVDQDQRERMFMEDESSVNRRQELDEIIGKFTLAREKIFKVNDQSFKPKSTPIGRSKLMEIASNQDGDRNENKAGKTPLKKKPTTPPKQPQRMELDDSADE